MPPKIPRHESWITGIIHLQLRPRAHGLLGVLSSDRPQPPELGGVCTVRAVKSTGLHGQTALWPIRRAALVGRGIRACAGAWVVRIRSRRARDCTASSGLAARRSPTVITLRPMARCRSPIKWDQLVASRWTSSAGAELEHVSSTRAEPDCGEHRFFNSNQAVDRRMIFATGESKPQQRSLRLT
jgi:hypothetical protein